MSEKLCAIYNTGQYHTVTTPKGETRIPVKETKCIETDGTKKKDEYLAILDKSVPREYKRIST